MSTSQPIEIIGGGLAGLSLGLALRRAGVPVTLFEAGDYPRHRVCGEFIAGLAPTTAARLGLEPILAAALHHHEVAWFVPGHPPRIQHLPQPALGLSRHALDGRLAQAFRDAGGDLRVRSRVASPEPRPGRVLATGRRRARSPWVGLKVHVLGLALERDLELHLGDQAYVGLSRVEGGRVNVCGLFRRRPLSSAGAGLILAYLAAAGLADLAARLRAAAVDEDSLCAVAAVGFDRRVPCMGAMTLGDACAMVPPFTGNGMAMAFQSAELALDPLVEFASGRLDWTSAGRLVHGSLRRHFRLRLASAHLLHPYLLQPGRQRWLAALNRAHLLPFKPLYAALH